MSQQPKTIEVDDEDEFEKLFAKVSLKLRDRTASLCDTKAIAKEHQDNPDLIAVKACIADRKAGRVDPRKSELWELGVVN